MNKKNLLIYLAVFLLLDLVAVFALDDRRGENLAQKYRDWLKLVDYIITDQEREVFLKLNRDTDREAFIEAFWRMRDPTPGTPENEYKEEIIKRFEYANANFKRGTSREGWQTDMGRIYIILGPPASIERLEGKTGIVPCQIWTYYGDTTRGLPSHFQLVFFQKAGVGEYKLYDPLSDGPYSLLENKRDLDQNDYEELYETIRKIAPTLAAPAITLVPGEYGPSFYQPSPRNAMILKNILEYPKKNINLTYATNFLKFTGMVSTEYLTNYLESDGYMEVFSEPDTGLNFVHFIISPKSISVDFYEPRNQYYCNFSVNVSVRKGDKVIFQYSREVPFYFPESELTRVKSNGLAVEDSFPLIEGQYQVAVLLQNTVGKEFCVLERTVKVPAQTQNPRLLPPLIGYKVQEFNLDQLLPFKFGNEKLVVDPKFTFSAADRLLILSGLENLTEPLRENGRIEIIIRGLTPENRTGGTYTIPLNSVTFSRIATYRKEFTITEFLPDYYEVLVRLVDGAGNILEERKANFIVSAEKAIGHPLSQARIIPLSIRHIFYYLLARQHESLEDFQQAERFYLISLRIKPDYQEAVRDFAQCSLKMQRFDRVLELSEQLGKDPKQSFIYHSLRGRAFLGKNDYEKAILELSQANQIYDSDVTVINALGMAFYHKGEKDRARSAFKASLKLNPDQPEVKKLLAELEKDRDRED